jgi:hypothetical protein
MPGNIRMHECLSRRDWLRVARHEMPGKAAVGSPSRRERYDRFLRVLHCLGRSIGLGATDQTVPTGRIMLAGFPGISCLATLIPSLRDKGCACLPVTRMPGCRKARSSNRKRQTANRKP